MVRERKQQKKRKRHSSPPFKSQIAQRLEKLRRKKKDLWEDDDDDDDDDATEQHKKAKVTIVLSNSDEERPSSSSSIQRRVRSGKSRKKLSHNHNENTNKNATCLICSIHSQLSSYNCCSQHLSILKNPQPTTFQWLPEQVMIVPLTDEIVQRYLDPQQIHHLRAQTSTNRKSSERNILTPKSLNKSAITLKHSETHRSSIKPSQMDIQPLASTIVVESGRSNSATIPPDISIIETSVINNIENITIIDDNQQENTLIKPNNNKQTDPWIPISDDIDAALEEALNQIDSSSDTPLEYSPTTVRRTETEIMAARLPKIPLKVGRFRNGKPIMNRTTTNAANEYRPLATTQSPPSTSSITITSVRSPPAATAIEKESSTQTPNTTDNHDDILTSCIFTQDETNHNNNIPTTTTLNNEALPSLSVPNENSNQIDQSNGASCVTSSTTNERRSSRMSFRMNPDGTRVSISRPPLPTNLQSPTISSLRRTSTDVTPIQPNTKQV